MRSVTCRVICLGIIVYTSLRWHYNACSIPFALHVRPAPSFHIAQKAKACE